MDMHNDNNPYAPRQSWLFSRAGIVTIGAVAILGFLVYEGHGAHLLGYAPFLLILACPLMHIFMHHDHGGHEGHDHDSHESADNAPQNAAQSKDKTHKHKGC